MRLTRLELLCYGAFEGRRLALREDARLHVVFGANEAGKSTSLAALGDLFFGFPPRTSQDFRFRQTDLRVGGEVLSRGGARLAFTRRKGNKNTLLDCEGRALPDDALAPFLGQMNRTIFSGAFGLDAECLRKGAQDLLQARGEAGSSLMAAASGLRGLAQLRKQLDEDADGVFTANKSQTRCFYQARDRYDAARKAIAESELRADAWKKINQAIADKGARLKELEDERRAIRAALMRISRLKSVAPLMRRIDQHVALSLSYADLPDVPPGFADALDAALANDAAAAQAVARATAARDDSQQALGAIAVGADILDRATDIEALVQRLGKQRKDHVDLPRVAGAHDDAKAELDRHARRLGLADAQALVSAQPTEPALALVRELAGVGRDLLNRISNLELTLRDEYEGRDALDAERARHAPAADPAPLVGKLAALGNVQALVSARDQKAVALRREADAMRFEAAALMPPVGDLAALAGVPIPGADEIASFAKRFEDIATSERGAGLREAEAIDEEQATRRRLEAIAAGGEPPTVERIALARDAREDAWAALRATLFGAPEALSGAALSAGVTHFELAVAKADALSDQAARDAARVADHASLTAALDAQTRKIDAIRSDRRDLRVARDSLEAEWRGLWSALGVAPRAPADMQAWRTAVRALLDRHARSSESRHDLERAEIELAQVSEPLASLASEAGLPAMELDGGRQSGRISARLKELSDAWDEARGMERRRGDIDARIAKLTRDLDGRKQELATWDARWRAAIPAIGLSDGAGVAEALAAIDAWKLAPQLIEKREDLARRAAGLRRDITAFEDDACALMEEVAPDLAPLPRAAGVAQLGKRLDAAGREAARREEVAKVHDACEAALREARRGAEEARASLARLVADLPEGVEPAALVARLRLRDQATLELGDLRTHLAEQADGRSEEDVRAELAGVNLDVAEAELASLAEREERLTHDLQEVYAELKRAEQKVAEHGAGFGSEAAWQQRMNAEAEMHAAAREWLVLRLASAMLDDALERHRATQQDPLMQRASEIFSGLTGGAFAGVAQTFDESDAAVLQGRRASGELVPVEGLSEGTRDQLYLALRLAYVEDYAARAEPPPFVADDLFTSFDDARTTHGLRALADTGAHLQCVLFTHHRHVADLAQAALGRQAEIVEL